MWRPRISIKDGKLHGETTLDKLILTILVTVVSSIGIYFVMLYAQNNLLNSLTSIRLAKVVFGTMLAIAPPLHWAILGFIVGIVGVIQYLVRLIKEKRAEQSKD